MSKTEEILKFADQIQFNATFWHYSIDKSPATKKWRIFDMEDDLVEHMGEFDTCEDAFEALKTKINL